MKSRWHFEKPYNRALLWRLFTTNWLLNYHLTKPTTYWKYVCNKHDWMNFKFVEMWFLLKKHIPNCHFSISIVFFFGPSTWVDPTPLAFPRDSMDCEPMTIARALERALWRKWVIGWFLQEVPKWLWNMLTVNYRLGQLTLFFFVGGKGRVGLENMIFLRLYMDICFIIPCVFNVPNI